MIYLIKDSKVLRWINKNIVFIGKMNISFIEFCVVYIVDSEVWVLYFNKDRN